MADQQSSNSVATAFLGMNPDAISSQLREGQLTYAHNAVVQNFDGKSVSYGNEQSNELCVTFPDGFVVIGARAIPELGKSVFFLVNPATGQSEIGYKINGACTYHRLVNGPCLNFHQEYPIRSVAVKVTNCSSALYWTDNYNPRRWLDVDNLPITESGALDCNRLLVEPNFAIPEILPMELAVGGDLVMGAYQFAVQYANALGDGYTSFYGITNPVAVWEDKYTADFNLATSKAISLQVTNLDTTGLYEYFNLVAIKTVNGITSAELVGTYPITLSQAAIVYSGANKAAVQVTMEEIFERFPYYDLAADVTVSDNTLLWGGLSQHQRVNYQQVWSKVELQWESWKIPCSKGEGYSNGTNAALHRGYMGDEVYALEGCFILKNGKITDKCHIPGRLPTARDMEIIEGDDRISYDSNPCRERAQTRRWQNYNTAAILGYHPLYLEQGNSPCYKGPYQYGSFGYWESEATYPDNTHIWGELAGKPIRHHRFPDSALCPIHDNNPQGDLGYTHAIYPKGIRVDAASVYKALQASDLSQDDINQIVGFKILRANRSGAKSVVAKGLFYNVGEYSYQERNYYFPNYPFNDLRPDPFLAASKVDAKSGANPGRRLHAFATNESRRRFTFHSPDTHFYQPFGVDTGYVSMETVEHGKALSHFVEVKENAKYKFLTKDATRLAFSAAMSSVITLEVGGGFGTQPFQANAGLQLGGVLPSFQAVLEVIKNITPAVNYGWQMNAVGNYCNSFPVTAAGSKIRSIELGAYLTPGMQSVGDDRPINNLRRESSVYVRTSRPLPFPHEVSSAVPRDSSRYLASDVSCAKSATALVTNNISAYYGAIKRILVDQYGRVHSYETVDTGYYHPLWQADGTQYASFPTVFGGDIFINRFGLKRKFAFFIDETVGKADGADINLDDLSNVAYPMFWYSTKPVDIDADFSGLEDEITTLTDTGFWTVLGNLVSGGSRPLRAGFTILNKLFRAYLEVLGVANINLDCPSTKNMNELGKAYLYAYGIPYFFVESEINLDHRQPTDGKAGDYYPNTAGDIPDEWLQETTVPIAADNSYVYNRSYSKQNKETFFAALRADFSPDKRCLSSFENRIIYSQKAQQEETRDNWLVYRPVSYFDLPKSHGVFVALDGIEDRRLLVRFYNKTLLYNVMATLDTGAGSAYLGNPAMFATPPVDFGDADAGHGGSQHRFFLRTPQGHVWVDALRGQVLLLKGTGIEDIGAIGMSQWFRRMLPFRISEHLGGVPTDNAYNGVGLAGVYDNRYDRIILTKRDYEPLSGDVRYSGGKFFAGATEITLGDPRYFCDRSWTVSFSFVTRGWISFHGYQPAYYLGYPRVFESGAAGGLYTHNQALSFGNFYGQQSPYILEYPLLMYPGDSIIAAIKDYTTVLQYSAEDIYQEPSGDIYFDKAVIYNDSQCSGVLELMARPRGNLSAYLNYPRVTPTSRQILYARSDHFFQFNTFWDSVADPARPFVAKPCNEREAEKQFVNIDYSTRSHTKARIRSKEARLRLYATATAKYKFVSKFLIAELQRSFK